MIRMLNYVSIFWQQMNFLVLLDTNLKFEIMLIKIIWIISFAIEKQHSPCFNINR